MNLQDHMSFLEGANSTERWTETSSFSTMLLLQVKTIQEIFLYARVSTEANKEVGTWGSGLCTQRTGKFPPYDSQPDQMEALLA